MKAHGVEELITAPPQPHALRCTVSVIQKAAQEVAPTEKGEMRPTQGAERGVADANVYQGGVSLL